MQAAAERRRMHSTWTASAGFRIKQVQPLFAHASGCSSFYYFHTCCSSLAPAFLNAFRRTSVSRVEALAITAARIEGCTHEFYSLPGVREDIVDDIFNAFTRIIFREDRFTYIPATAAAAQCTATRSAAGRAAAAADGAHGRGVERGAAAAADRSVERIAAPVACAVEHPHADAGGGAAAAVSFPPRDAVLIKRRRLPRGLKQLHWGDVLLHRREEKQQQEKRDEEEEEEEGQQDTAAGAPGDAEQAPAAATLAGGDATSGDTGRSAFVESGADRRSSLNNERLFTAAKKDRQYLSNEEEKTPPQTNREEVSHQPAEEAVPQQTADEAVPQQPAEEEEKGEFEYYYRIPVPRAEASFEHPIRGRLRVKGPLVVVAGHLQLPPGIEILNKNEYLFTVNAGYYVNIDVKIERIREYVLPESGYDSLQRDVDSEGFIYFPNYVSPIPVFAFAAERRGEAVHSSWNDVPPAEAAAAAAAGNQRSPHRLAVKQSKEETCNERKEDRGEGGGEGTAEEGEEEGEDKWRVYVPGPRGLQQVLRETTAAAPAAVQPAWCRAMLQQQQHEKEEERKTRRRRREEEEERQLRRGRENQTQSSPFSNTASDPPSSAGISTTGLPSPAAHGSSSDHADTLSSPAKTASALSTPDSTNLLPSPSRPPPPASSSSSSSCSSASSVGCGSRCAAVAGELETAEQQQHQLEEEEAESRRYSEEYLSNDLPYQNLGEVVTLEVQTDGSITPREGLLHCCDDLTQQTLLVLHALRYNCHAAAVDGNDEEEFEDPDWYQDAQRYIGVPWNPYKKAAARTEDRQQFFFKADVLRQYNLLREKTDALREASAAAEAAAEAAATLQTTAPGEARAAAEVRPRMKEEEGAATAAKKDSATREERADGTLKGRFPCDQKGRESIDYYVAAEVADPAATDHVHSEHMQQGQWRTKKQQYPKQQQPQLSKEELQERLLDEEEEEERLVNRSVILRKEREEAWRDKQRMFRELAENERLKFAGDGKGMPRYPLENRLVMQAPDWVFNDPMGPRMPLGYSELEDD